jgi:hypothetical protein
MFELEEQPEKNASIHFEVEDNGVDAADDRTHTLTRFGRKVKTRKDI